MHTCPRLHGGGLHFFLLQAIAIIFEGVVFSYIKRAGLEHRLRRFRWLGYVWVWCWFFYSLPPYWNCLPHTGMFLNPARNFSLLIAPSYLDGLLGLV